jgi:hypothetical protein
MSSHAIAYSSLRLNRARIFFLAGTTQHVETTMLAREVGRALAALAALAAWAGVIALFA